MRHMFILHVDLAVKPDMIRALEQTYRQVFCPAVSAQAGFSETKLLRAKSSETPGYRLVIAFENEEFQKKWVTTDLHQEVWTKMEEQIAEYSAARYEEV